MEKYKLKIFRRNINYKVFFLKDNNIKDKTSIYQFKIVKHWKFWTNNFQKIELKEKIIINDSSEEEAPI